MADTPSKQQQGLMFRNKLGEDSGMAFKFSTPKVLNFWNLNTYIPLDIAFISPENKIIKITNIEPISKSKSIKTVSSDTDCSMAIEANIDFFSKNGIEIGDKIDLEKNEIGETIIIFKKIEKNKGSQANYI